MPSLALVYDVRQAGFTEWHVLAFGFCALLLASGIAITAADRTKMMFGWFAAVFVVFVVAWLVLPAYVRYRRMSSILASGQFATVEGLVTNFSPGDEGGHVPEWFTVNGHSFKYSESDIDPGFHRVRGEGGPLRNGAYVRIAEIDGRIARLEMAR